MENSNNTNVIDSSVDFENLTDEQKDKLIADEVFESDMKEQDEQWNKLAAERDDYKNKYLYAVAEIDNQKKRFSVERQNIMSSSLSSVIMKFLPVVDDFERAIKANESVEDVELLKSGFDTLYNKMISTLKSMNVSQIDTADADFNTDYHEAISTIDAGEDNKNKIIDCVEKGYTLNDKVIRHSKVVVGS